MKRSRLIAPAVVASPAEGTAQTSHDSDSYPVFDFAPAAVVTAVWQAGVHDGTSVRG